MNTPPRFFSRSILISSGSYTRLSQNDLVLCDVTFACYPHTVTSNDPELSGILLGDGSQYRHFLGPLDELHMNVVNLKDIIATCPITDDVFILRITGVVAQ